MTRLLAACLATGLLVSCSDEPEVVVVEPIEADEVDYGDTTSNLRAWDTDGDGMLNEDEYRQLSNTAWGVWDINRDGSLSLAEFEGGWTEAGFTNASGAFDALDQDNDDVVKQADFLNTALWDEWDANQSGILEPGEFAHY